MENPGSTSAAEAAPPPFLADDVALDFLNTAYGVAPDFRECLGSDEDVRAWLEQAGLLTEQDVAPKPAKRGGLLQAALQLRATGTELVERRKAGLVGDASELNRILALGQGHLELRWKKGEAPRLGERQRFTSAESVLVPLAEAIARLLAEADFELVRQCESTRCTLWFYDRTKSHHRRWCSMARCGNRAKVAAFRARRKGG